MSQCCVVSCHRGRIPSHQERYGTNVFGNDITLLEAFTSRHGNSDQQQCEGYCWSVECVSNLLKENNINYQELKNYLMGELAWNKLINGLFFRLTSISDLEVDELISKNPSLSVEQAENLVIQRQLDLQSSKLLRDIMNEATIEYK